MQYSYEGVMTRSQRKLQKEAQLQALIERMVQLKEVAQRDNDACGPLMGAFNFRELSSLERLIDCIKNPNYEPPYSLTEPYDEVLALFERNKKFIHDTFALATMFRNIQEN